jgi:putative tryptophan/tyrosine transport system substrate-binding protein
MACVISRAAAGNAGDRVPPPHISPDSFPDRLRGFRRGLKEAGNVEGNNVTIAYQFIKNEAERLPAMAVELARRHVAVISAANRPAAKEATATIPIVVIVAEDPVQLGLLTSLARPDGNLTGINLVAGELAAKRLELLHQLFPEAARIAVLFNQANAPNSEATLRDVEAADRAIGLQIQVLNASTNREIDTAFAALARARPDALFVGSDPFFTSRCEQLAILAAYHSIPAITGTREIAEVGGLMSYGIPDAWRQAGAYCGRILKGTMAAELPVVQASTFEFVINAQTCRTLSVTQPPSLIARRRRGNRMRRKVSEAREVGAFVCGDGEW